MQAGKQEQDDIDTRPMFFAAALATIIMFASYFLVVWLTQMFRPANAANIPAPSATPADQYAHIPEFGMLQRRMYGGVQAGDAYPIKQAAKGQLDSYGWTDKSKGMVHVPIERAMEMVVAQRGNTEVPAPAPSPAPEPSHAAPAPSGHH